MIALGSDHAGFPLKQVILDYLDRSRIAYIDVGTKIDEKGDYPIYAKKVVACIASGNAEKGILFCGTGIGMAIAANKFNGIRCAVCSEPYSARMSRTHNNCNILALGSRVVGGELAIMIVNEWLETEYDGGRHTRRLEIIHSFENESCDAKN